MLLENIFVGSGAERNKDDLITKLRKTSQGVARGGRRRRHFWRLLNYPSSGSEWLTPQPPSLAFPRLMEVAQLSSDPRRNFYELSDPQLLKLELAFAKSVISYLYARRMSNRLLNGQLWVAVVSIPRNWKA